MGLAKAGTKKRVDWFFVGVVAAMLALILATRLPGLMHGAEFHPDEYVFYATVRAVVEGDWSFQTVKAYPNGAFVYQLPFHLLAEVYNNAIGWVFWLTPIIIGRLCSVAYFCGGSLLGAYLVWRLSARDKKALVAYGLIMVFSLFHLEQSRYGTGDPITFFVLMLVLWLLWLFGQKGRLWVLYLAVFFVGSLAAIKLPLALALLLPLGVLLGQPAAGFKNKKPMQKIGLLLLVLLVFVAGLGLFTPALFSDPAFLWNMLAAEGGGYFSSPNEHAAGNPLNHLLGIVLYQLLYADVPLATLLAGYGVFLVAKGRSGGDGGLLFRRLVPVFLLLFLLMNIVVNALFLRALYPFFFVSNLYAALGLAALAQKKRPAQVAAAALCVFMVGRGVLFSVDLAGPPESEKARDILQSHPAWAQRNLTAIYGNYFVPRDIPERTYAYPFNAVNEAEERGAMLQPGEFLVTGAIDIEVRQRPFHEAFSQAFEQRVAGWAAFQEENAGQYVGQSLPRWKYLLYGGGAHGSTLAAYEFPVFYVYYRDFAQPQTTAMEEKRAQYGAVYATQEVEDFFAALAELEDITLLAVGQGDVRREMPLLWQGLGQNPDAKQQLAAGEGMILVSSYPQGIQNALAGEGSFDWGTGQVQKDATQIVGEDVYLKSDGTLRETVSWTEEAASSIVVGGRDYSLGLDGLNIAIYDNELGRVMEWVTIRWPEGAEKPQLLRQRP